MGYYTYYTLEVEGGPAEQRCPTCGNIGEWDWKEMIAKFLGEKHGYGEYYTFEDSCKWYECDKDMLEFSQLYPEYTFIIEGDGEDTDDRWRAYYKNGKMHKDEMIMRFPDFDPETLK
jgi:hypothetical protein